MPTANVQSAENAQTGEQPPTGAVKSDNTP